MTAAAMIVGMIPMAIGGPGEEQNAALARAVIGGLLFATPTTLLIVPYLFAMLRKGEDGKSPRRVWRRSVMSDRTQQAAAETSAATPEAARRKVGWGAALLGLGVLVLLAGGALHRRAGGLSTAAERLADGRAEPRFRSDSASHEGEGCRSDDQCHAAGDDAGADDRRHLCPRQRLHRQTHRRHRRQGEDRRVDGSDHRARARPSDRAGKGHARPRPRLACASKRPTWISPR